jgi:antitoxin component of RelBE/YafQ-DinJ toxin-antitoxin module
MTTIVILPKTKAETVLLTRMLKKMNIEARIVEEPSPNEETLKAMEEVKQRRGKKAKDSDELFTQLGL